MQLIVKTSCGHTFVSSWTPQTLLSSATFDCPSCGRPEILDELKITVETTNFHQFMHNQSVARGDEFVWPADGAGTGYIDVGDAADLFLKP